PSEAGAVTVRASIQELGISLGEKELAIGEGDFAVEFEAPVPSPRLWSHEQPNLYTVLIEWEYGGKTFFKAFRFGFKKIEIRGNVLYLNGKRLILRGVNRHDFDPGTGWTLTPERYHEDLRLLKRLNVNAIRTSHYPNDPLLYSLCDEYGILVMDEADIETHGVRRKIPANSPVWTAACVDRMRRMVLRDRNHACVVFWSLGNESGRGGAFAAMRKAAGALDDTRPFHYEGEHNKTSSDVISRMYPDEKTFKKLCAKKALKTAANPVMAYAMYDKPVPAKLYETMPVLLCEFAHCMGNSLGNFSEYTAAFEKYPHMCGGFIWDFADQAIRREDGNGRCQWLHGDDFLEVYSQEGYKGKSRTGGDGCFCGNGIVSADRKPHPAALEVKKCYQTLRVMAVEGRENRYRIFNNQMFSGLENYALVWQFACGGVVFEEGEVPSGLLASIGPGQSAEIDVEPSLERPASGDITLTFSWRHKKAGIRACAPAFCEDGYEQAFDQFALRRNRPVAAGSLSCNKNAAGNFTCRFERGVLASVKMNAANGSGDRELLAAAVQPNLYRALTDNDIGVANFARFLRPFVTGGRWERAAEKQRVRRWNIYAEEGGSWKKRGRVPEDGKTYRVSAEWKHPLCRSLATDYTVYPDGKILLEMRVRSKRIGLVRAGVQLALGEEFGEVEWYGRGPHECYPDRKSGARLGRYQCPVEELGHGYLRPQENGARCDVSWIEIKSRSGVKIRVQDPSGAGFLFSAWPYSQKALERATHIHTLQREALTTLSLDSAMCGVGGDLPGIASLHEAYRLKAGKTYTARFLLEFEACNPNG
ncbi:MAG: DUF4981 domain-containing protein, partial [Treponema sp.]|nr:DUF4981 domain-containing protein [Treponema sp.]